MVIDSWRATPNAVTAKDYHRATLNFGDCCAYALAAASGEPLLFKGEDVARTDTPSALPRP